MQTLDVQDRTTVPQRLFGKSKGSFQVKRISGVAAVKTSGHR